MWASAPTKNAGGQSRPLPSLRPTEIRRAVEDAGPYEERRRTESSLALVAPYGDTAGRCGHRPLRRTRADRVVLCPRCARPISGPRSGLRKSGRCLAAGKNVPPARFYPARPYEERGGTESSSFTGTGKRNAGRLARIPLPIWIRSTGGSWRRRRRSAGTGRRRWIRWSASSISGTWYREPR